MTVVAIDGPVGSGKSTVARRVAGRLGYLYLDTGAMYRAVGLLATEALPGVRRLLVERQRTLGSGADIVMEGRDIGTNVFPDAAVKVFLTARPEIRAARRAEELRAGGEDVDVAEVLVALLERDRRDSEREVAPLRQAADAVEVDTSALTLDEVVAAVVAIVERKVAS
jgi:cytidylate kinase